MEENQTKPEDEIIQEYKVEVQSQKSNNMMEYRLADFEFKMSSNDLTTPELYYYFWEGLGRVGIGIKQPCFSNELQQDIKNNPETSPSVPESMNPIKSKPLYLG